MSIFEHWECPDAFFLVSTRHQNNNSPIQDYVHPADQTQPTFLLGVFVKDVRSFQVKWYVLSKPVEGLSL